MTTPLSGWRPPRTPDGMRRVEIRCVGPPSVALRSLGSSSPRLQPTLPSPRDSRLPVGWIGHLHLMHGPYTPVSLSCPQISSHSPMAPRE